MMNLLVKFAEACRAADLRVSTAEVIDCARQLEYIDISEETRFKTVLKANFAKSRREQRAFDRLYQLFFHEMASATPENESGAGNFRQEESELLGQLSARSSGDRIDQAILDFLAGEPSAYLQLLRGLETQQDAPAAGGVKSNLGQLAGRMEIMLRINAMGSSASSGLAGQGNNAAGSRKGPNRAAEQVKRRLEIARRMLTEDGRPLNDGLRQVRSHQTHFENLGERPFSSLTPRETEEMRDIIKQLVRKLKDRMGRRYAAKNRGSLDVRRTLRHAGRFQGVPVIIKYRNRPLRKTRIVALCDVSGSVWSAAGFMLNMLYSMQDCFSAVHSFAFVCGTTDITEIFENHEANRAVEKVLSSTDIRFDSLTDYGSVFSQFKRDHMHLLNRKTTVIILGDARSNYHNPGESILEEIREKSRRIIWLNPEPEAFWATGDSEMNTYKAYCHEVRPCMNLNQLIDFIEDLVI
ncbi:MAG: vWA domain-containing protein [Desulfobacterales bacterium]